jgi:hypothetical protein
MNKRAVIMTLAALFGVATIMIATLAPASGDEGAKVRFAQTQGVTTPAEFAAAYSADFSRCATLPCVVPVTTVAASEPHPGAFDGTLSGDVHGTGSFTGTAILGAANDLNPATIDFPFESYEPLSVTVEGCGKGTFILHLESNLNSNTGQWWIVPNTGRGGLAGISGNGSFSAPAPFAPESYIGHIRCAK